MVDSSSVLRFSGVEVRPTTRSSSPRNGRIRSSTCACMGRRAPVLRRP